MLLDDAFSEIDSHQVEDVCDAVNNFFNRAQDQGRSVIVLYTVRQAHELNLSGHVFYLRQGRIDSTIVGSGIYEGKTNSFIAN